MRLQDIIDRLEKIRNYTEIGTTSEIELNKFIKELQDKERLSK
jgi:uncharacterized protein with HEPN domain